MPPVGFEPTISAGERPEAMDTVVIVAAPVVVVVVVVVVIFVYLLQIF